VAAGKNMSPANIETAVLAASPLIGQVVAINDRRPYVVALIVLDPDAAEAFAAHRGAGDTSAAALATPAIHAAVGHRGQDRKWQAIAGGANQALLHPADLLGARGDEITPTMKFKRRPITAKYAEVIDVMYATTTQPV
jgi:long-chain acyl-CoA synthetase